MNSQTIVKSEVTLIVMNVYVNVIFPEHWNICQEILLD